LLVQLSVELTEIAIVACDAGHGCTETTTWVSWLGWIQEWPKGTSGFVLSLYSPGPGRPKYAMMLMFNCK